MRKTIIMAICAAMCTAYAWGSQPKLVVGVYVEGLDYQYLESIADALPAQGALKILAAEGTTVTDIDFGTEMDGVAATALVSTGAPAALSGVDNEFIFERTSQRARATLTDKEILGNYTDETYSPNALAVTTMGDELRIAGAGLNRVYAIAPGAQQAILLAGHAANNAAWLNTKTGNWATTTYYKDVPTSLAARNRMAPLSQRIDTMKWEPMANTLRLPQVPDHLRKYPFRHTLGRNKVANRYQTLTQTPMYVREAFGLARDYIRDLHLGQGDGVDMLNVAVNIIPPAGDMKMSGGGVVEKVDAYAQFDAQLRVLYDAAKKADPDALFFVVGLPSSQAGMSVAMMKEYNIPTGQFSPEKASSLLNMYLLALHGNGNWVLGYHNRSFYLNHALISEKNLEPTAIAEESAEFLRRMAGVAQAQSVASMHSRLGPDAPEVRNVCATTAGDVHITVAPGWEILSNGAAVQNGGSAPYRASAPTGMLLIAGPGVAHAGAISGADARQIAPTITRLTGANSPNGSALAPLKIK